jgi:hypothetical protein
MSPIFNKSFFKFLFGFLGVIAFGLLGVVFSARYFEAHKDMFATTNEVR